MSGRGRGRGKPMSLNIEALGFGRGGDSLPTTSLQPPPTFPALERHPLPLEHNEKSKYLVDLKRYFQTYMEDSPYHVKRAEAKKDIARYSDKYKLPTTTVSSADAILYFRMPEELRPRTGGSKRVKKAKLSKEGVQSTIQALEKKEGEGNTGSGDEAAGSEKSGDEDNEEGALDDVELDEEDMEEDNDYIQEYFDNGETFGDGGDDDGDDGPVY